MRHYPVVGTKPNAFKVHAAGNIMHTGHFRSLCGKPFLQLDPLNETFEDTNIDDCCERCVDAVRRQAHG